MQANHDLFDRPQRQRPVQRQRPPYRVDWASPDPIGRSLALSSLCSRGQYHPDLEASEAEGAPPAYRGCGIPSDELTTSAMAFLLQSIWLGPGTVNGFEPGAVRIQDWSQLLTTAARHGILPQFERAAASQPGTPVQVSVKLADWSKRHAGECLGRTANLLSTVEVLTAAGIPSLPFKGPVLAIQAFGDLSARQYGDLDILVRDADLERAVALISGLGYVPYILADTYRAAEEVTSAGWRRHLSGQYEVALWHPDTGEVIELHWRFAPGYFGTRWDNRIWDRATELTVGGRALKVMAPMDSILSLAVHMSRDRWLQLNGMAAMGGLIHRNPSLDWDALEARAARWRCLRAMRIGVGLASTMTGCAMPPTFRGLPDDRATRQMIEAIERSYRFGSRCADGYLPERRLAVVDLRAKDNWLIALSSLLQLVFIPTARESETSRLPPWAAFFDWARLPLRLLREAARRARAG